MNNANQHYVGLSIDNVKFHICVIDRKEDKWCAWRFDDDGKYELVSSLYLPLTDAFELCKQEVSNG